MLHTLAYIMDTDAVLYGAVKHLARRTLDLLSRETRDCCQALLARSMYTTVTEHHLPLHWAPYSTPKLLMSVL